VDVMKNTFSQKKPDKDAEHSVALPFILFSYIVVTYTEAHTDFVLLTNIWFLLFMVYLNILLVRRLTRRDKYYLKLKKIYDSDNSNIKGKAAISFYGICAISFVLLMVSIY